MVHYPRWLACLYAFLNGYFWLPCPHCGRKFGGHEVARLGGVYRGGGRGSSVCWRCGEATNEAYLRAIREEPIP